MSTGPPDTFMNSMASGVAGAISEMTMVGANPKPMAPLKKTVSVNVDSVAPSESRAVTVTGKDVSTLCGEETVFQSK